MSDVLALSGLGDEAGRTLGQQIAVHRELGWTRIELRTVDGVPVQSMGVRAIRETAARVADAGLRVPVVASSIGSWSRPVTCRFADELAELRSALSTARALSAPFVRVMAYPNDGLPKAQWRAEVVRRMSELARRAEHAGVVLLLENCAGWAAHDADRALELLLETGSPALRLLFDLGNPIAYDYDGLRFLDRVLEYVEHIHVKDAVPEAMNGGTRFTAPGQGDARVGDCLRLAVARGYEGCLSIEPEIAHVFHLGRSAPDDVLRETYIGYAQRFEALLLEVFPGSRVDAGELRLAANYV